MALVEIVISPKCPIGWNHVITGDFTGFCGSRRSIVSKFSKRNLPDTLPQLAEIQKQTMEALDDHGVEYGLYVSMINSSSEHGKFIADIFLLLEDSGMTFYKLWK